MPLPYLPLSPVPRPLSPNRPLTTDHYSPRMLRRLTLSLLLAASLASAASAAEPTPGKSKIPVLRNTTILLGPLDSQGYVDYAAAINKRFGQGVKPADNALVGFLEINGKDYGATDEYYDALGMAKPKADGDELERIKKKFAERRETTTSVFELIHDGEMAEYLVAALHPKPANLRWWIEWGAQESDFIVVAYALALHRAEVGWYPDRLAELKPLYLPSIPRDRYAGDELKYRRDGRKYALYSVGRNGLDEGGKNGFFYQDSTDTSDDEFFWLRVGAK